MRYIVPPAFALVAAMPVPFGLASPALAMPEQAPIAAAQDPLPATTDTLGIGEDNPGRMTVPVTIGSAGPYAFTIDTGAERTVISRELAASLGLEKGRTVNVTAMTGSASVDTVIIPSLQVSTVRGSRIEAPTLFAANLGAPGLLGVDTLKNHAVVIDFDSNTMTVRPSTKRIGRYKPVPGEIVVTARSLLGQLVVTDADYRGHQVRVILDTGSVVSMGNLALQRRAQTSGVPQAISLLGVTGASMSAPYTQIADVRIGQVIFHSLPVAFADAAPFRRLGLDRRPAILLGMDALKQFRRVEIDFANHEVRLALPKGLAKDLARDLASPL